MENKIREGTNMCRKQMLLLTRSEHNPIALAGAVLLKLMFTSNSELDNLQPLTPVFLCVLRGAPVQVSGRGGAGAGRRRPGAAGAPPVRGPGRLSVLLLLPGRRGAAPTWLRTGPRLQRQHQTVR